MRHLACLVLLALPAIGRADDFQPEPGFELIFNGKDLTGWKTKAAKDKPSAPLDEKSEAFGGRFKVREGELVLDPKVKGDVVIETTREFAKDVTIRFEFKPGKGCNNDLFFRGQKFDIKTPDVKNLKEDEWNTFEIAIKAAKVEFKTNGEVMRSATTKVEKSILGIRAEAGPVVIRRLRAQSSN